MSAPRPATDRERIMQFLRDHPDECWCSECVSVKIDMGRGRAANVFLTVEGRIGFRRRDGLCSGCGRRRIGLLYTQQDGLAAR